MANAAPSPRSGAPPAEPEDKMSGGVQRAAAGPGSQEEYEDDFEKDLDWLIDEEARSEEREQRYEDFEAELDKELEEDEKGEWSQKEEEQPSEGGEHERDRRPEGGGERWPSPTEPLGDFPHADSPHGSQELDDDKKYVLEKIQQANRQLQKQSSPSQDRQRRLQFKDTLVDLVVPPLDYERDAGEPDVSERMSGLRISGVDGGAKEGRVLVEKDGKFDLVSLREVESQGLLPPLYSSPGSEASSSWGPAPYASTGSGPHRAPKPPSRARNRPSSAGNPQQARAVRRRVQSASSSASRTTFALSPRQKGLQEKLQHKKERLRREEQQQKQVEEDHKQQENERAFQAWLSRKREQQQGQRRLHRAQEIERISCTREASSPHEAFQLWLQRKQEQQERQRQLDDMRRLEEESTHSARNRDDCERAFSLWLRKKRSEKKLEQQAARERSRRLVMEARRVRRARDLLCSVSDTRNPCFVDRYSHRF